jgi:glutamate-1-semialdehyde 2,1-aminomutase/neamine transaminase/2'-deamino-2'-hydroxyneamine transaminase/neomycin C transaminase
MLARAQKVTAARNWEIHPRFPFVFERAHGAHTWDAEGNRYVDFTSCSGAAPLGVGHKAVLDRTVRALHETGGIVAGPLSTTRVEVAERLREVFPGMDRALFFRTGSCATTAAVRLARVHTGHRRVLTSGFHGWHDWHLQYRPHLALPDRDPDTADFGYDLDLLAGAVRAGDVAAVIYTPEVNFFPHEYARELAAIACAHGALLIVDEVMTGFRYAWGGYAAAAGTDPDLVVVSKGLANGTALSAVLGRDEVMNAQESTYLGNTYQREVTPFAAALATLDVYEQERPAERITHIGRLLMDGLNDLFAELGVPAWCFREPAMFDMVFADASHGAEFCARMWERGYLMQYGGRFLPSAANSEEDVFEALAAARESLSAGGGRPGTAVGVASFAAEHFAATAATVARWSGGTR